jgi:hypothetical protein
MGAARRKRSPLPVAEYRPAGKAGEGRGWDLKDGEGGGSRRLRSAPWMMNRLCGDRPSPVTGYFFLVLGLLSGALFTVGFFGFLVSLRVFLPLAMVSSRRDCTRAEGSRRGAV